MTGVIGNDRKPGIKAAVLQQGCCGWVAVTVLRVIS